MGNNSALHAWYGHPAILNAGGTFNRAGGNGADQRNIRWVGELFEDLLDHLRADGYLTDVSSLDLIFTAEERMSISLARDRSAYAICASIGSIRAIWNLLVLSLCDPGILPGYPGDEEAMREGLKAIHKAMLFQGSLGRTISSPNAVRRLSLRITKNRHELCELLFKCIFDYILHHEVAHLIRNHMSMLHAFDNEDRINEADHVWRDEELYQLLELDADLHAMDYSMPHHPEFRMLHALPSQRIRDFILSQLFGYIIVQQLFDLEHRPMSEALQKHHPPPVLRALIWSNSLIGTIKDLHVIGEKDLLDEQNKTWYEASKVASKLGFPEGRWRGSHMRDVPFNEMEVFIAKYRTFEAIIDQDNLSGNMNGFRRYMGLNV